MTDYWTDNNLTKPQEVIVCAANKCPVAGGFVLLCGARHWDTIMGGQAKAIGIRGGLEEQGFINQFGEFRDRKEALAIVKANGQPFDPERNGSDDELFSEGLY